MCVRERDASSGEMASDMAAAGRRRRGPNGAVWNREPEDALVFLCTLLSGTGRAWRTLQVDVRAPAAARLTRG